MHLISQHSVYFLFSFLLHVETHEKTRHFSLFQKQPFSKYILSHFASGHLLGLSHDDSKFCEERFGVNSDKRLMSSILTSIDASKPWSRCTSATITDFFDDGNGECWRLCRILKALGKENTKQQQTSVIFIIRRTPHSWNSRYLQIASM